MEILILQILTILVCGYLIGAVVRTFSRACRTPPLPVLPPVDFNYDKLKIELDTTRSELMIALEALEHYADYDHGTPARIAMEQIRDPLFKETVDG